MIWLYMELQERFSNYGSEDEMTIEEIHSHYFEEDLQVYDVIKVTSKTKEQKSNSINTKKKQKIPFRNLLRDLLKIYLKKLDVLTKLRYHS